ncbi:MULTISPECIES: BamA/TamA family outer membrane protein [unclassified Flavobacterium]|uniref:translocation and assembly module lipoprotein TamL n=1 Tax=unclassified Flavobacterium TaxID=196869 RepID=UPI0012927D40|nr:MULTISPECIES: BamA/TamA family outer membrane protein [unclassified Flavobacterium]MQP53368.1 BamA/TamA family outer membrane protein [Flavobacterium sp. LMO9]MQP62196.1 BamA/TamA family outer membrane protein [Flavobacterium sp. LMO6]
MRNNLSKITLLFVIGTIIYSCSLVKRVPESEKLLTKNEVFVNEELIKEDRVNNLVVQQPNTKFLNYPFGLLLYNSAKPNPDSTYQAWLTKKPNRIKRLNKFLSAKQVKRLGESFFVSGLPKFMKETGEAPVIIDEKKALKSKDRLSGYYYNNGYIRNNVTMTIDSVGNKRGKVVYKVTTGKPYFIDSIFKYIETPVIDSLYTLQEKKTFIKKGDQYNFINFDSERKRITQYLRNNGVYHFQESNIKYNAIFDDSTQKMNIDLKIEDRYVKDGDLLTKRPFSVYKISHVNIFTNNTSRKESNQFNDSITYNNFTIYSAGKLKYKPKAITNAIFIEKGKLFSDIDRTLTTKSLSNLKVFTYPNIEYIEDPNDSTKTSLIANIYLMSKPKYIWQPSLDVTTSDIQEFGISARMAFTWRNLFKRAETFELSAKGNIGSSKDLANPNDVFFNISEYGIEGKLSFPRIVFPVNTRNIIKKEMLPSTNVNVGLTSQRNIGLDKENLTGVFNYNWTPKQKHTIRFDLLNIQFIKNLNPENYFNVYTSSYNTLNDLAQTYNVDPTNLENGNLTTQGAVNFIEEVQSGGTSLLPSDQEYKIIRSIGERRERLIENNLILSSAITFFRNTKANLFDNNFYSIKAKVESSGNVLSLLANTKNEPLNENGNKTLFGIEYSQYIKGEIDFIKHWDFGKKNTLAMRAFAGLAVPYGNGQSIPFSRSYFSGGSNDNRGWQAYSLGPGRSGGINDFNEANLKLAYSLEYRFRVGGNFHSAFFADIGNIWNIFDNITDEDYTFNGFRSFEDLALGSGIGLRYDFSFFVFRFDLGYKTYDPGREVGDRWLKGVNFSKTVLNFGINYPF